MDNKQIIKVGELVWPEEKHGEVDHFTLKSIFHLDGKDFVVSPEGKNIQKFLEGEKKNTFTKVPRKFYQKILGFRSKKRWKQITAILIYLFIASFIIGFFNGEDEQSTSTPATKSVTTKPTSSTESTKTAKESNFLEESDYKIVEERLDGSGIWYVTMSTKSTSEQQLKKLVSHVKTLAKEKNTTVSAAFVIIKKANSSSASIANGKFALNDKGLAQTGLNKIGQIDFEYLPENISKEIEKTTAKYTANDVVKAFNDAGLATPEERDNTSKQCSELGCSQLITTEAVSIYQWPNVEKAREVHGKSFGDYQAGTFIIRFNNQSVDKEAYNKVLDNFKEDTTKKQQAEEAHKVELAKQKAEAAEAKRKAEQEAQAAAEAKRQAEQQAAADKAAQEASQSQSNNTNVFYANCSEVEAAGVAPISQGQPGYSRKLDRDGDGIACNQ